MALFWPGTPCALCHAPIEGGAEAIGFAALPDVRSEFDHLYDACVHRTCLNSWSRRAAFVEQHNDLIDAHAPGRLSKLALKADGNIKHEVDDWSYGGR